MKFICTNLNKKINGANDLYITRSIALWELLAADSLKKITGTLLAKMKKRFARLTRFTQF